MAHPDDLPVDGERIAVHKHPHVKMLPVPVTRVHALRCQEVADDA